MTPPQHHENDNASRPAQKQTWLQSLRSLATTILVIVLFRAFVMAPFTIPSGSMIPTLMIGDYVAVTKYDYGWSHFSLPFSPPLFNGRLLGALPHRGDVAVFRYTHDTSIDYIKRIVGLPGDHIAMREGRLYINGNLVPRDTVGPYHVLDENNRLLSGTLYYEVLPASSGGSAVKHDLLQWSNAGFANNTEDYVVPSGYVFAMGDDRDDSADSRFQGDDGLGYVPVENLIGKARVVFFSVDGRYPIWQVWRWPAEIRWGRLFSAVR